MVTEKNHTVRDEKETGRIEAFSDGVFAIAITLLVLDIKVPHFNDLAQNAGLLDTLVRQWPAYTAFFISFSTILIMWVSHHRLFNYIKRSDDTFLFLNGAVLLLVTFIPFPTALLSEYIKYQYANVAAAIYSGTYLAIAALFNLLWWYASKKGRLLDRNADLCLVDNISKQYILAPPLYAIAFALAFIHPAACIAMCFVLVIFFAFTGKISRILPCEIPGRENFGGK